MLKKKPHIIIFNPDQWRSDVMGHMGNPAAVTPNLDEFVRTDAVSFRNAFCQNTVCTPSRCSFMTGWYPHVRGHRTMYHMLHPEFDEPNLLKILKDNGYYVWWGGKNDLTPGQEPVDQYCHERFRPSQEDLKRWGYEHQPGNHGGDLKWRGEIGGDNYFSFYKGKLDRKDKDIYFDGDWAMVLGAIDKIKNYKGDKPLCIYLPIGYPHPPYCVEEPWFSITDREKLPPRILPPENYIGKASILKGIAQGQGLQNWTESRWNELRATYYGMCSRLDDQFRRLVDAMKESGIYDDAAIFLFSDHGDYTGDYGIVEKTQNTFEDCLSRVPFIIKTPKDIPVKPGVNDALAELVDFSATVYDLTGIEPGYDHFGKSLLPLITGKTGKHRDAVFCEGGRRIGETQAMERQSTSANVEETKRGLYYPRIGLQITDEGPPYHTKAAMCRTKDFKYIHRLYEQDELYDLKKDPGEVQNVIDDPAYCEIRTQLRERLLDWYQETCDVVPQKEDKR
jgi:arylsulfatase A-like enzyme